MQQLSLESQLDGCVCLCVLGEESQSRWGYVLCFMVTERRINHCFIQWLSVSVNPSSSLPFFSFFSISFLYFVLHLCLALTMSVVQTSLCLPPPSFDLTPLYRFPPPFTVFLHHSLAFSLVSSSCHHPSAHSRSWVARTRRVQRSEQQQDNRSQMSRMKRKKNSEGQTALYSNKYEKEAGLVLSPGESGHTLTQFICVVLKFQE